MRAGSWVFCLAALLSLASTVAHNHSGETDIYHVSVGHLFVLRCLSADAHSNVTWSRAGRQDPSLPTGVEVRNGLLWFLPVQMAHHGSYTCEKRDKTGSLTVTFGVSVSSGECPESDPLETKFGTEEVIAFLPCKQPEILRLNKIKNIRWRKDCLPLERPGGHFSVDESGFLRLPAASERDAGKYTCLVDVIVDGRMYTAARSIRLKINKIDSTVIAEPEVLYPQQKVVVVEEGARVELECLAYIGFTEDKETFMFWTIDCIDTDEQEEADDSFKFVHDRGRVYGQSNLSISKVLRRFLNVPISCHVSNSAGLKEGIVWLQEADHSALYTQVALCLAASLAVLGFAATFLLFKVDLVLAHRKLVSHFSKQQASDGKLYDAYVSFLPPDSMESAEMASLALQMLPEELEKQHGYSLYIRGRDDCPGEAMHDVIAATVRQSRRLIIILSPTSPADGKVEEVLLCDNQNHLCYEQKVGLYDALTQNDPRVILVEIDGPVDYSCLPESLRYIKSKQGALKWKKPPTGTHKLTKLRLNKNGRFWKNLRYHMPSVPAGRLQTVLTN